MRQEVVHSARLSQKPGGRTQELSGPQKPGRAPQLQPEDLYSIRPRVWEDNQASSLSS